MNGVVFDPLKEKEGVAGNMDDGVELELTPAQMDTVVLTKYTSTIRQRADFQPDGIWWEQFVADVAPSRARKPRILAPGISGEPEKLTVDHGIYFDIHGTLSGQVGIMPGRPPMSEMEVEDYLDSNPDEQVQMFNKWEFRVVRAFKTCGPQARIDFLKGEDQKRKQAQTEMYDSFTGMFQNMMTMMASGQLAQNAAGNTSPSAQSVFDAGAKAVAAQQGDSGEFRGYDDALPDADALPTGEVIEVLDDTGTQEGAEEEVLQRR